MQHDGIMVEASDLWFGFNCVQQRRFASCSHACPTVTKKHNLTPSQTAVILCCCEGKHRPNRQQLPLTALWLRHLLNIASCYRNAIFVHTMRLPKNVPGDKILHCYVNLMQPGPPPTYKWKLVSWMDWSDPEGHHDLQPADLERSASGCGNGGVTLWSTLGMCWWWWRPGLTVQDNYEAVYLYQAWKWQPLHWPFSKITILSHIGNKHLQNKLLKTEMPCQSPTMVRI